MKYVLYFLLGVTVLGLIVSIASGRQSTSRSQYREAQELIKQARRRAKLELPGGPVSEGLFARYSKRYTLPGSSFEDCCALLVSSSLSRCRTKDDYLREFHDILTTADGLLITAGELMVTYKISPNGMSLKGIETDMSNAGDRKLFETSMLADNITTVWSYTVGMKYHSMSGGNPTLPDSDIREPLNQSAVDSKISLVSAKCDSTARDK